MAGPGSGRRRLIKPDVQLPDMGDTEESLRRYIEAINIAIVNQKLDRRDGEVLLKGASAALRAVIERQKREETYVLKRMLEEAREVAAKGLAFETADRQHVNHDDDKTAS